MLSALTSLQIQKIAARFVSVLKWRTKKMGVFCVVKIVPMDDSR